MNIKVLDNVIRASNKARNPKWSPPNKWISAAEISIESDSWTDYDGEHCEYVKVCISNVTIQFNELEFKGTYGTLRMNNTFIGMFNQNDIWDIACNLVRAQR